MMCQETWTFRVVDVQTVPCAAAAAAKPWHAGCSLKHFSALAALLFML